MVLMQQTYSRHLQRGVPGLIARPNAPYDYDEGVAGVQLVPGDGVYHDAATDTWIKPVSAATQKLVTHIVSFNASNMNADIVSPIGNNTTQVVYAIGQKIDKLAALGSFWVVVGEAVKTGDPAVYNYTTGRWVKYNPTTPTANDLRRKEFTFYLDPKTPQTIANGVAVEVRVGSMIHNFATFTGLPTVVTTTKVTLTAAQIKALRATPFELVAAQGANQLIDFVDARLVLNHGTEVLTESADNMTIYYDSGSGAAVSQAIEATGFIDAAVNTATNALAKIDQIAAITACVNKNIALKNIGDGEYAGNATADATLDVYTTYRVISLA
jgi:hypothetical protein